MCENCDCKSPNCCPNPALDAGEKLEVNEKLYYQLKTTAATFLSRTEALLNVLGLTKNDCIVCGSVALFVHRFMIEKIHDVDLEIKDTPEVRKALRLIAAANPIHNSGYGNHPDRFDLSFQGVPFNIFLVQELSKENFMYKDYFKFKSVLPILQRKFQYRRPKDIEYFANLQKVFAEMLLGNLPTI